MTDPLGLWLNREGSFGRCELHKLHRCMRAALLSFMAVPSEWYRT